MSEKHNTIGRFELSAELGRGSMGIVHLAHDPVMGRDVAIKTVLLPHGLSDHNRAEYQERFSREARAAGRLSHPGIVTIYDFNECDQAEQPFIAMEYVEGPTLHELISSEGALNPDWVLSIGETLADALQTAHNLGVIHRDLKPANILIRESDGTAKISDFGIARINRSELTEAGVAFGSPAYMAPERLRGERADPRSDLFSLAVILYEALTGKRPFGGEEFTQICYAIVNEPPIPVGEFEPDLSPAFDAFFEKTLAKESIERYQDGAQFRKGLKALRKEMQRKDGSPIDQLSRAVDEVLPENVAGTVRIDTGKVATNQATTDATSGSAATDAAFPPVSRRDARSSIAATMKILASGPVEAEVIDPLPPAMPAASTNGRLQGLEASPGLVQESSMEFEEDQPLAPFNAMLIGILAVGLIGVALGIGWILSGTPTSIDASSTSMSTPQKTAGSEKAAMPGEASGLPVGASEGTLAETSPTALWTVESLASASNGTGVASPVLDLPGPNEKPVTPSANVDASASPRKKTTPRKKTVPRQPKAAVADASASTAAATDTAEPDSQPVAAIADAAEPQPVASGGSYLQVQIRSSIKAGKLTILVDGQEAYSSALVSSAKGRLGRVYRKALRKAHQDLETRIEVGPGAHTIAVQVYSEAKDRVFEESVQAEFETGQEHSLQVVAGRTIGQRLSVSLD